MRMRQPSREVYRAWYVEGCSSQTDSTSRHSIWAGSQRVFCDVCPALKPSGAATRFAMSDWRESVFRQVMMLKSEYCFSILKVSEYEVISFESLTG